jgi:hypothetical protein
MDMVDKLEKYILKNEEKAFEPEMIYNAQVNHHS